MCIGASIPTLETYADVNSLISVVSLWYLLDVLKQASTKNLTNKFWNAIKLQGFLQYLYTLRLLTTVGGFFIILLKRDGGQCTNSVFERIIKSDIPSDEKLPQYRKKW